MSTAASIFGPSGTIPTHLPGYEPRPEQVAMAEAVAEAIVGRHHLMVEAGTGIGKSFAYLVPAILAATSESDCRVIVSTHTISLQEQLVHKDLPFLARVMPRPFKAVLAKGRSNYLSLRRLQTAQQRMGKLLAEDTAVRQLMEIGRWSRQTREGSRSDLPFEPLRPVWDLVESDSGNCLGRKCPTYGDCYYYKARRQAAEAHLIVVNHALFFSDLVLRRSGGKLLPDYRVVIFDEAHTLEDVASEHLGIHVGRGAFDHLFNSLHHPRHGRGLLAVYRSPQADTQAMRARNAVEEFFDRLATWVRTQSRPGGRSVGDTLRVRATGIVPDLIGEEMKKLAGCIDQIAEGLHAEEETIELRSASSRCLELAAAVAAWLGQELPDQVYWIEASGAPPRRLMLASAPIDVGPALREQLFSKVPTAILTSATLSSGGKLGFGHLKQRLGIDEAASLQLGSPFDYQEQAELHLFRQMPDPNSPAYEDASLERVKEYLLRTEGRAFVLFTSYQSMQRAAERLRDWAAAHRLSLLSQGDGVPRSQMIERFRATPRSVLLGVDSFWQGVDVQGESLSNVIITRLPFQAPDRPIVAARQEAIEARGGSAFFDYQIPLAVIKLKQGFGRLIRTRSDRGIVVILDPRVLTKGYGKAFLDALPPCAIHIDGQRIRRQGDRTSTGIDRA